MDKIKMKTETQIGEENVKFMKENPKKFWNSWKVEEHKASCQRFLVYLDNMENYCDEMFVRVGHSILDDFNKGVKLKVKDLKQAIKLYSDNGI